MVSAVNLFVALILSIVVLAGATITRRDPTSYPTYSNTNPSVEPTIRPSLAPTEAPTLKPSRSPTTCRPSVEPTPRPSREPTEAPTVRPTTTKPTIKPTQSPSYSPTSWPTSWPSNNPSSWPSSQPTDQPTTTNFVRTFSCEDLQCESLTSNGACTYFSRNVALNCVDDTTVCYLTALSISIESANFTVYGDCPLVLDAAVSITIQSTATVSAAAVNLTTYYSASTIEIDGIVTTSGRGPKHSLGTSSVEGQGGSYGGSGGRNTCNATYYSNTNTQVGSVQVLSDVGSSDLSVNPTYGSGGGAGGGSGGGRIILDSSGVVKISSTGSLLAEGGRPTLLNSTSHYGAGSGGSITIIVSGTSLTVAGVVSVRGGDVLHRQGGAGGGGRVGIYLGSKASGFSITNPALFQVEGGRVIDAVTDPVEALAASCQVGGVGTVYIQTQSLTGGTTTANLYLYGNYTTYALTLLDSYPSSVVGITAITNVAITSSNNLLLPRLSSCGPLKLTSVYCSVLSLTNSVLVSVGSDRLMKTLSPIVLKSQLFQIQADLLSMTGTQVFAQNILQSSFNISGGMFTLSASSSIKYTADLTIVTEYKTFLYGLIKQSKVTPLTNTTLLEGVSLTSDNYLFYSYLIAMSASNLTVSNIYATNLRLAAHTLMIAQGGVVMTASYDVSACHVENLTESYNCRTDEQQYLQSVKFNNTFVFVSNGTFQAYSNVSIAASAMLICAKDIYLDGSTALDASYRGCKANAGAAAGSALVTTGGGGGGYRGAGGTGFGSTTNNDNGATYGEEDGLYSGSGGGCLLCNSTDNSIYSTGGGIISVVGQRSVVLYGNLTSNGGPGGFAQQNGGGAGGSISVNTGLFQGQGVITANGGAGSGTFGLDLLAGGGGGGGYVRIYNTQDDYTLHTFSGTVVSLGGVGGSNNDSSYQTTSDLDHRRLDLDYASGGSDGAVSLPDCPPGYGNSISSGTGTICNVCPKGYYGTGGSSLPCKKCENAPHHSYYPDTGQTSSDCEYLCDPGYSTSNCYSPFENFFFNTLGTVGISCVSVAFFMIILIPLVYYRLKKTYGWFDENKKGRLDVMKRTNLFDFSDRSKSINADFVNAAGLRIKSTSKRRSSAGVSNPMQRKASNHPDDSSDVDENEVRESTDTAVKDSNDLSIISRELSSLYDENSMKEMRLFHRFADHHMSSHACRINLLGSNHPFKSSGGPWVLPTSRPVCLRPILLREEYKAFAEEINEKLKWPSFGYEVILFYLLRIVIPPMAPGFMSSFRRRRAKILLDAIAHYDYACFRCPDQRAIKKAFRIGISPDCTLAYIDVLYNENKGTPLIKPLCPVGQTKLPAAFKLAGLGTYFSPYFVDTNDIILQAVPQTDVASSFIDEAWITFIVELNAVLRTVQSDAVHLGILRLMRFLQDEKNTANLGGLLVEFCTFSNVQEVFPSDQETEQFYQQQEEQEEEQGEQISSSTPSLETGDPNRDSSLDVPVNSHVRDTIVKASRANRNYSWDNHSASGANNSNWLASLGDAIKFGSSTTPPPAGVSSRKTTPAAAASAQKSISGDRSHSNVPSSVDRSNVSSSSGGVGVGGTSGGSRDKSRSVASVRMSQPDSDSSSVQHHRTSVKPNGATSSSSTLGCLCGGLCGALWWLLLCVTYPVVAVVQWWFKESFRPEDPHGYELSFNEMCNAIQEGNLKMGILVTHSKVGRNTYIPQDEDYQSEQEEEYLKVVPLAQQQQKHLTAANTPSNRPTLFKQGSADIEIQRGSHAAAGTDEYLSSSPTVPKSIGSKAAAELSKFYKIVHAADKNLASPSTAAAATTATTAPAVAPSVQSQASLIRPSMALAVERTVSSASSGSHKSPKNDPAGELELRPSNYSSRSPSHSSHSSSFQPSDVTSSKVQQQRKHQRQRRRQDRDSDSDSDSLDESEEEEDEEGVSHDSKVTGSSAGSGAAATAASVAATASDTYTEFSPVRTKGHLRGSEVSESRDSSFFSRGSALSRDSSGSILSSSSPQHHAAAAAVAGGGGGLNRQSGEVKHMSFSARIFDSRSSDGEALTSAAAAGGGGASNKGSLRYSLKRASENIKSKLEGRRKRDTLKMRKFIRKPKPKRETENTDLTDYPLAPSALQYPINAWRLSQLNGEPIQDKVYNARNTVTRQMSRYRSSQDEDAVALTDTRPSLGTDRSSMIRQLSNNGSPSLNVRKSATGATAAGSNSEIIFKKNLLMKNSLSNSSSSNNNNISGVAAGGASSSQLRTLEEGGEHYADTAPSVVASSSNKWLLTNQPGENLKKGFQTAYMNKLFLFHIGRIMFRSNVYPRGPPYIRKILEFIFFLVSIGDIMLCVIILIEMYCLSDNTTQCSDHTYFYLTLLVWPGALLIAPISGFTAMILGPSGTLARIYGSWSRIAAVNNMFIILVYIKYFNYFDHLNLAGAVVFMLTSSRIFQCLFVDLYIAHVEKLRFTRGWDGLHTSLFKTKDNDNQHEIIVNPKL